MCWTNWSMESVETATASLLLFGIRSVQLQAVRWCRRGPEDTDHLQTPTLCVLILCMCCTFIQLKIKYFNIILRSLFTRIKESFGYRTERLLKILLVTRSLPRGQTLLLVWMNEWKDECLQWLLKAGWWGPLGIFAKGPNRFYNPPVKKL